MSSKLLPQNRIPRNFQNTISRRSILRGAGVAMALPFLESLPAFGAAAAPFPKRFAVIFMGCGINEDYWSATGDGADMKLSKTLAVLEPLKHKINVVDGLFNKASVGLGIHPAQTAAGFWALSKVPQGRDSAFRHERGSDDRQHHRTGHCAIERGTGVRSADDRVSRDEFTDGVQFAHFVAKPGFAVFRWNCTLNWHSITSLRIAAACEI